MSHALNLLSRPDMNHEDKICRFQLKKEAVKAAHAAGWLTANVHQARDRFQYFWVIGQQCLDTYRLVTKNGYLDIPFPGYVK